MFKPFALTEIKYNHCTKFYYKTESTIAKSWLIFYTMHKNFYDLNRTIAYSLIYTSPIVWRIRSFKQLYRFFRIAFYEILTVLLLMIP